LLTNFVLHMIKDRGPSKQPLLSPEFQSLLWVHYFLETEMKSELLLDHGNGIYLFHLF
jgi:hypothetical protein